MEDKLKALDLDLIIPDAGKYGIVGIFEGVKQAAEFELVHGLSGRSSPLAL